jgi:hypothetical protein
VNDDIDLDNIIRMMMMMMMMMMMNDDDEVMNSGNFNQVTNQHK